MAMIPVLRDTHPEKANTDQELMWHWWNQLEGADRCGMNDYRLWFREMLEAGYSVDILNGVAWALLHEHVQKGRLPDRPYVMGMIRNRLKRAQDTTSIWLTEAMQHA